MNKRLSAVIGYGLCFLIVFPPLAFGAVYPWAFSILELVSFSLLMLWLIAKRPLIHESRPRSQDPRPPTRSPRSSLVLPFAIFIGLILFQMVPMPPSVLRVMSPQTYALYCETLDGYGDMAKAGHLPFSSRRVAAVRLGLTSAGAGEFGDVEQRENASEWDQQKEPTRGFFHNWRSLSVYRQATKAELLKILAYASAFLLVFYWADGRSKLLRLLSLLVATGFFVSIIGLAQRFFGIEKIYGFWSPVFKADQSFFGPYVNPNHFGGYMALIIPIAMCLLLRHVDRVKQKRRVGFGQLLARLHEHDPFFALFLLVALMTMTSGLFLSLSRGGILAFAGSMVFLTVVLWAKGKRHVMIGFGLMAGLFVLLFDFWLGFVPFQSEIEGLVNLFRDPNVQGRFKMWGDGWSMLMDFPLFGTGLGTFAHLYPKYKTILDQVTVLYPESDVVPIVVETGLVGFGVLVWFFVSFFKTFWSQWTGQGRYMAHVNPKLMAGLAAGIVALLIHAIGDFNLHIPANALQFAIVMGLALKVKGERIDVDDQ